MGEIKPPKIEEEEEEHYNDPFEENKEIKFLKDNKIAVTGILIGLCAGCIFAFIYLILQCNYHKLRADLLYQQNANTNTINAIIKWTEKVQQPKKTNE